MKILVLLCLFFCSDIVLAKTKTPQALAMDQLGQFSLSHFLLDLQIHGGVSNGFDLGGSQLGVRWDLDNISAQFTFGADYLVNHPYWVSLYEPSNSDDLSLVEAYAEVATIHFGSFYLGKLPLYYGHPHENYEEKLWWDRSYLFAQKKIQLRDYGFQHFINHAGYYSRFSVHNGEGGQNHSNSQHSFNEDGNFFYTMSVGKEFRSGLHLGMSGQVGSFVKSSEPGSFKYRLGTFYASWENSRLNSILSVSSGEEKLNDDNKQQFATAYLALEYKLADYWRVRAGIEAYDPDLVVEEDQRQKTSFGISYWDKNGSSSIHIIGNRETYKSGQTNDGFLFFWRLKSRYFKGE